MLDGARRTIAIGLLAAVAAGCGAHRRPPVVSPATARRIAAQWTGAYTYLPTWAPRGVVLRRWEIVSDAGAGNDRLLLHLASAHAELEWTVSDSRELVRMRTGVVCRDRRPSATIHGPAVFFRQGRGISTAWACRNVGFPLTVSATQRAGALNPRDLERLVASARPVPPGAATGERYELPPATLTRRMAAVYGSPLFLPIRLPPGFIYSSWSFRRRDPDVDGRRALTVTFGRDGIVMLWGMYRGFDRLGLDCPRRRVTLGRRIQFSVGIHGASAWTCIERHGWPIELNLWYDIRADSPAMRRTARELVATARVKRI